MQEETKSLSIDYRLNIRLDTWICQFEKIENIKNSDYVEHINKIKNEFNSIKNEVESSEEYKKKYKSILYFYLKKIEQMNELHKH